MVAEATQRLVTYYHLNLKSTSPMRDQCHLPFAHVNAQCEVTFQTKYCLPPGAANILEEIATEIGGFDVKV